MPGFIINGVGAGAGAGPVNTNEYRRKHRWIYESMASVVDNVLVILKASSRPSFTFDEPEVHHNQEQIYLAGKQKWESAKMTWYDSEQPLDASAAVWKWLNTVVKIHQGNIPVSIPSVYKKNAVLKMLDGAGSSNSEGWNMFGCWPQSLNWGDLDYTDTEVALIECTMRFDRANRL